MESKERSPWKTAEVFFTLDGTLGSLWATVPLTSPDDPW